jgi:ribosomal protein S18 acetylase RimI-like enzyme
VDVLLKDVSLDDAKTLSRFADMHYRVFGDEASIPHLNGHWWFAYDGQKSIGFCGLAPSTNFKNGGYLCRAGVMRAYRGQGLQKKMIRLRERKAYALGWSLLVTDTTNNPASANSLIDCGFKTFIPATPWSLDGAVYWRKTLD